MWIFLMLWCTVPLNSSTLSTSESEGHWLTYVRMVSEVQRVDPCCLVLRQISLSGLGCALKTHIIEVQSIVPYPRLL